MSNKEFYDGTKLLSLQDINGKTPELYFCTSNRQGGKTTYFSRLLINRFRKGKGKFILLYRNKYEVKNAANKFFSAINELFFPNLVMTEKPMLEGNNLNELFIGEKGEEPLSCGYAVSLKAFSQVKSYSNLLADATSMFFDEFQPENNAYLPNEINAFLSLHTSIARGHGKQSRYLPVYFVSNNVTLINPYYVALGISERMTKDTHFLRGDGFVMETTFIESAAKALEDSGTIRAFRNSSYVDYALQNVYLNDNQTFIGKPDGIGRYMFTLSFDGKKYSVWQYPDVCFVSDTYDATYPLKFACGRADHDVDFQLVGRGTIFVSQCRRVFDSGGFRFKNLECKRALMNFISY